MLFRLTLINHARIVTRFIRDISTINIGKIMEEEGMKYLRRFPLVEEVDSDHRTVKGGIQFCFNRTFPYERLVPQDSLGIKLTMGEGVIDYLINKRGNQLSIPFNSKLNQIINIVENIPGVKVEGDKLADIKFGDRSCTQLLVKNNTLYLEFEEEKSNEFRNFKTTD